VASAIKQFSIIDKSTSHLISIIDKSTRHSRINSSSCTLHFTHTLLGSDNNIVDGNVNQLDKESNKPHHNESHPYSFSYLNKFWIRCLTSLVRLGTSVEKSVRFLSKLLRSCKELLNTLFFAHEKNSDS
jgi:hypothetical protein